VTEITQASAPGGGAAAAHVLALAASLLEHAAECARPVWEGAPGAIAQARALGRRAQALSAENAAAYAYARAALAAPREHGDAGLGRAVADAAGPPLALCACAADVAQLGATLVEHGAPEARADAVVAARLAAGAAAAAGHLVGVNLVVGTDPNRASLVQRWVRLARAAADRAAEDDS
jgi:formiminotetrahydrofolate cyclodeaminase